MFTVSCTATISPPKTKRKLRYNLLCWILQTSWVHWLTWDKHRIEFFDNATNVTLILHKCSCLYKRLWWAQLIHYLDLGAVDTLHLDRYCSDELVVPGWTLRLTPCPQPIQSDLVPICEPTQVHDECSRIRILLWRSMAYLLCWHLESTVVIPYNCAESCPDKRVLK